MSEIEITKSASSYLKELLEKQDENTVGIKIFVTHPGTPRAETCIAYTKDEDDLSKFVLKENQNFNKTNHVHASFYYSHSDGIQRYY